MIAKLGGRKFLLSMSSLLSATVLCYLHHISDGVYSAALFAIIAAYNAANVTQKLTKPTP